MDFGTEKEQSLFDAALQISGFAEREAFLDQSCANDLGLRARIKKLLAAHTVSDGYFSECISDFAMIGGELESLDEATKASGTLPADEQVGACLGRYKLVQQIGEGGCGVVYLAEQEEPVRRRMALKVIKLGMDTKSVIARFEAERQALAMMDHPNIAKVFDAGATSNGRPYFVMELVKGVKVTEYCDQNHLDTRQRLNLFIQVCHAIQHAHQKGIIHRDIKPSNVLVTLQDGEPVLKVIDFGIAKATEGRLTDNTFFTLQEQVIGTPAYMSPEQAAAGGQDIDTRSDIYSLGVLLYELLTGKTPFDSRELLKAGLDEMRRTLRDKEPHRPSTRLDTLHREELTATANYRHSEPPKLKLQLRGDLDWIVMKALEKDRKRRYETANGLAVDVQRHLNNEPVIARPPSRFYRFQKLVRRNKVVFAAIAAVSLALLAGSGTSMWFFFKERKARQQAVMAEKVQNQLRQEAETREKITQAMLLISQNKYQEADQLVVSRLSITKPTLEGAAVLRSLGEWHVLRHEWSKAADRFAELLQVNQLDKWNTASLDFLRCGASLLQLGDSTRYQIFCRNADERFVHTENPTVAERILLLNLLLPGGTNDPPALTHFAALTVPKIPVGIDFLPLAGSISGMRDSPVPEPKLRLKNIGAAFSGSISNVGPTLVIRGGGANIWGNADSFTLAWLRVTNDFDYRLRIISVADTDSEGKHFSRAGLMARDSLANPSCHEITVAVNAGNTFQNLYRNADNGFTTDNNALWPAHGSNSWVRLQRIGTTFYTYGSNDGIHWTQLFQFDSAADPDGPFANPIYLGIAVCAHNAHSNTTAVVSDFGLTPTVPVSRTVMLALLEYRRGHYDKAIEWCRRCLGGYPNYNTARVAAAHVILAMSYSRLHETEMAKPEWRQAQQMIREKFDQGFNAAESGQEHWFDWVFARTLLHEVAPSVR